MRHRNGGNVWVMALFVLATIVSAWQYSEYRSRQRRQLYDQDQAKAQALAAQQRQAEEEARRQEEVRRQEEIKAMQEREAAAKMQKDALSQALKAVDDFSARWEDASRVASVTSRMALSGPVTSLQNLKREATNLAVPPCLDAGKAALIKSINGTVEAYMIFMAEKNDLGKVLATGMLRVADEDLAKFKSARSACPS